MRRGSNTNPHGHRVVLKQTVPRSGSWLHGFKISKDATSTQEGPELLGNETERVREELKSAVKGVLHNLSQMQARQPIQRRWVGI